MSHSDLLFGVGKIDDPEKRFLQVAKYYLSGWHIKPKGVKKPYVVILPACVPNRQTDLDAFNCDETDTTLC